MSSQIQIHVGANKFKMMSSHSSEMILFLEYSMNVICDDTIVVINFWHFWETTKFSAKFIEKLNSIGFLRQHITADKFGIFWKPNCLP